MYYKLFEILYCMYICMYVCRLAKGYEKDTRRYTNYIGETA